MAVANDGSGTPNVKYTAASSISLTTFTVGSGSNRFLVVCLTHTAAISAVSITWDSVALTNAVTYDDGFTEIVEIWVLINPHTGNKTLAASWTGVATGELAAIEFSGADQTTGYNSADNQTATNNGTTTVTIPSATNDATVAFNASAFASVVISNQTTIFTDNSGVLNSGGSYALGGTSNAHSFADGNRNAAGGIHVLASINAVDEIYPANIGNPSWPIDPVITVY